MKNKITAIFQNSIGIGFAVALPCGFLFALNGGLLQGFSIENKFIIFISYLTVVLYSAWMGGVLTCESKELSPIVRGLLSTFFVNIFSVAYFYRGFIDSGEWHLLALIVLLNCLLAIYGCQIGEKYSKKQTLDELGSKGSFFVIAVCLPFLFYGVLWMMILGAVKLMSL